MDDAFFLSFLFFVCFRDEDEMSLNGKIDGTDWLLLSQISSHLRKECFIFISLTIALYLALNSYRSCKIVNTELPTFVLWRSWN